MEEKYAIPQPTNEHSWASHFESFVELVNILRVACPWDKKQTQESLAPMLVEEVYEVAEAIAQGNQEEISKELGDILLHVVMQSVIAEEKGHFTLRDIIEQEHKKLVFRHPHVFGESEVGSAEEVKKRWEQLKMKEGRTSVLEGVPIALPSLLRAQKVQEKAAGVGFEWETVEEVRAKVQEEMEELSVAISSQQPGAIADEFGDVLFSFVNLARYLNINAEQSLQGTTAKFIRRFSYIERQAAVQGLDLDTMTLAQMDALWNEAKSAE